ncbi:TetR/AcrR family transcriptional regulator [Streptomyces sp. JH14]|uniref:TetR/AcrR family transcriptional regulator n=1 Tax=Streptomyces sp. JH14 TaxID=2793630 RepID=UPI0023F944C9|nr:TetR/AcrR family transcriptional regulator [Streptomyces sp. JH14]MDF6045963.1 TetR/AcrR family transcriptional regulator [Streptomyces sp. JH14]
MPRPANPLVRENLLSAGLALFHAQGFNAVGIKEITDTAGVPKGSFYSYYGSKNAFAAAVLGRYWTGIVQAHGAILSDASMPPAQRVIRFFEALTQDRAEQAFALGCLIGNLALELSDQNEEAREELASIMARWSALVAGCLAEARTEGGVAETPEAGELASMVIEAWEGAAMRGRVDRSRAPYDRFLTVSLPRLIGVAHAQV